MKPAPVGCIALTFLVLLTGCTSSTPRPAAEVGTTLAQAESAGYVAPNVIDLSQLVAGVPLSYNGAADPSAWVIVAGCYKPNKYRTSDFGVIPTTSITPQIRKAAAAGRYDGLVPSCSAPR